MKNGIVISDAGPIFSLAVIDDKKAREIATSLDIQCIGTLGVLLIASREGLIKELRPHFKTFIANKRYYSITLLNNLLKLHQEKPI